MEIAIIGGGITGLTTAIALNRKGIRSTVYESAPELNEIGAGVWLQPNAVRVMDVLGMKEKIIENGAVIRKMEITNNQLIPFKEIKAETVQDEFGNSTIAIHRGRLQKILFDEVSGFSEIKINHQFESFNMVENKITLNFRGKTAEADLILGCDGIHSQVRKQLFPNSELRDSNQICWRGIAKIELPQQLKELGKECWGKQIRFGFSEVAPGTVYWFGVANKNENTSNLKLSDLPDFFSNYHSIVPEIIRNTENIHTGNLCDLKRLASWSADSVYLLGDAAHATTPNMGQGACQGIEDAFHFSNSFSESNPKQSFQNFESKRRKKVDYIVNNSWRFGKMAHSKIGQSFMKVMMKTTPQSVLDKTMRKLYSVD